MPRSRKRHHSRSRSKSRSSSRDRSHDKPKKNDSYEKDGKRRRVDEVDSPLHKRSLSSESHNSNSNELQRIEDVENMPEDVASIEGNIKVKTKQKENKKTEKVDSDIIVLSDSDSSQGDEAENLETSKCTDLISSDTTSGDKRIECSVAKHAASKADSVATENKTKTEKTPSDITGSESDDAMVVDDSDSSKSDSPDDKEEKLVVSKSGGTVEIPESSDLSNGNGERKVAKEGSEIKSDKTEEKEHEKNTSSDSDDVAVVSDSESLKLQVKDDKKEKLNTPKKPLTPRQLQKKLEIEKRKLQKQKEREGREKQKLEEKAKILEEKEKLRLQKEAERQKLIEQRQKEKEMREEQKRKEKEEKEQKRKEKEEQEAQKRKEKELEKLKREQEIEEKNREKQREEEKKQKTAALFVGFFKKKECEERERKTEKVNSNFMPFEVKSDMRLPPDRRNPLRSENREKLDSLIENQDVSASYLKELKSGAIRVGKTSKTWPYEDPEDEVTMVEEDKVFGETICEDNSTIHKTKAKFLYFHDNRRPAYFGTWRKKSKFVGPRQPFGEDTVAINYEEDSDDDWEDEEQGESLDASNDEEDKDGDNAEDEYEVDNEFFVPHGHLSDDEVDDEETARLSPESLKQKLKLLKDEFDEDIKSKTHKLKPRSIGCIWLNKKGDNVEEAIKRYLQPFAMIIKGQIEIKKRSEIFATSPDKKKVKTGAELPPEHVPYFLKIIHGNVNRKKTVVEQFLTYMANNGFSVEVPKISLLRFLNSTSTYRRCKENGPMKNKFGWFVNDDICEKYNVNLESSAKTAN